MKSNINIFLENHKTDIIETVHSQIAKFLSENRVYLKIEKKGKKISENTFGENDYPEWWNKLK